MAQPITDYKNYKLGMSWGTPFADGYGISPTNNQELMDMLSGKTRGRYQDRGYTYLGFDKTKTAEGKVVYSLVDSGQSRNAEWQSMKYRKGELEVVGLETEDMREKTIRLDKGSQQSDPSTRVTVDTSGRVTVGIWTLEWQRDGGGKLKALVATANANEFKGGV